MDTLFVRLGDVAAAITVAILVHGLHLSIEWFEVVNLVLAGGWIFIGRKIIAENTRLSASQA